MKLLDQTNLRDIVDYSFGDQSGDIHQLWNGYMKDANSNNTEFILVYNEIKKQRNFITLFIDNIRLYYRENVKLTAQEKQNPSFVEYKTQRLNELYKKNDLLKLCSELPDMNFVIFTGFEDTPIDEQIHDKIPKNVIGIYASNAISFGEKVHPLPYGIQRKMYPQDNRQNILLNLIDKHNEPKKLLYLNHNVKTNNERQKVNDYFSKFDWVTIESPKSINEYDYNNYLMNIKSHKFMICPDGNAIGCDCHRDWEVIYMRRVPIIKKSDYLEKVFKDIPVLFVNSFDEVNQEFLEKNDFLYQEMQNFDIRKLNYEFIYTNILKNCG
jgi:hypothetical protein